MAFPYKKILFPVDFDENSMAALDKAVEVARHLDSTVILVHVVQLVLPLGAVPPPAGLYEDQEADAKAKLADIATQKLGGLKHESHVFTGDVIASILEAQGKYQPDLLVMATHGRRGLARMFLGSVTESVVRKATCPVLTIREEVPSGHATGEAKKPPRRMRRSKE